MIQVTNLTFAYEHDLEREVLKGITFSLPPETVTAIIGLSGCGKSTLCQILCGIIPQCIEGRLSGDVYIGKTNILEEQLSSLSQRIGYMMQDPDRQLIAATVEDELAFGPENLALPPLEIRGRVEKVLDFLEIRHLASKNPAQLSGGQKQLVAAGAVLTMNPDVLVMDEPLSHVDESGKANLIRLIKLLRDAGKTVLVVEHDYELLDFADQWLVLEDGRVKACAPPSELVGEEILP